VRALLVLLLALAAACGTRTSTPPVGHVRVTLDTDAPLPSRVRGPPLDDTAPIPLFDALWIEVLRGADAARCADCLRESDADRETFAAGASFTVVGAPGEVVRLHVLLYRRAAALSGALPPGLEAWVALPPIPAEGAAEARVFLPTETFARPVGSREAPRAVDPSGGPSVGTWEGARRTPCSAPAPSGMACVPGGAYLSGDPTLIARADTDADEPHLIVLSPFYVDTHEVEVAAFRALGTAPGVLPWTGSETGTDAKDWCTYTATPSARDALPMVCVSQKAARAHCLARGGDLPTEAQFEYVAGGMRGRRFPWGDDLPACEDAIWGRGGFPGGPPEIAAYNGNCRPKKGADAFGVPYAVDRPEGRARDRVSLGGVEILDLAGNVSEWTRDAFQPQSGPCFHPIASAVLRDPTCAFTPGMVGGFGVRGGSIVHAPREIAAAVRQRQAEGAYLYIGFRCVRPG